MVRRSFHSTHAASQALHPMHVLVSMYLETTSFVRIPVFDPHIVAEERWSSSACSLMFDSSRFLELDEERLVLGRPGIRVADRRRQEVCEWAGVSFVSHETPVKREADVPEILSVDLERRKAARDHRRAFDRSACRNHFHSRPVGDALLRSERLGDLHEKAGL